MKPNVLTVTEGKVISVTHCARCGGDHEAIVFSRLRRPLFLAKGRRLSWWALCPTFDEPILLGFRK